MHLKQVDEVLSVRFCKYSLCIQSQIAFLIGFYDTLYKQVAISNSTNLNRVNKDLPHNIRTVIET